MLTDDDADVGVNVIVTQLAYAGGRAAESWKIRPPETCYFFTSGHSLASSGLAASSGEIVAMVL
jgi:hypothetical protein